MKGKLKAVISLVTLGSGAGIVKLVVDASSGNNVIPLDSISSDLSAPPKG